MKFHTLMFASACLVLGACDQTVTPAAAPGAASAPAAVVAPASAVVATVPPPPPPMAAGLDVGKTSTQATRAPGAGKSLSAAVNDAIRTAILQVNGTTVNLNTEQYKFALDAATPYSEVNIRATGFADVMRQQTRGAITGFKLDSAEGPDAGGIYKVWIEAQVAKYTAPEAEAKKIKLVVAPIRFDAKTFTVGGRSVPATQVAQEIRGKILETLAQSGRFAVLDREFDAEVQQELDMVESGQTPNAQFGKLGQAFSADLIWIGRIRSLGYVRHSRELRATDRELVSYSGGWAVSQKLVNVATRQVLLANSLQDQMPATAPTTLGVSVDSDKTLSSMQAGIAQQVVASIMSSSFPVSIVSRDGNSVILSQGANAVKLGARYQVVALGAELRDPQTGQSLGRTEAPCCEVVIDRVTPTLSYGHLEAVAIAIEQVPQGGLLLREAITRKAAQVAATDRPAAKGRRADKDDMGDPVPPAKSKRGDTDW
jgi:hypothetical protein